MESNDLAAAAADDRDDESTAMRSREFERFDLYVNFDDWSTYGNPNAPLIGYDEDALETGSTSSTESWERWIKVDGVYSDSHDAQRYFRRGRHHDSDEDDYPQFAHMRARARWRVLAICVRSLMLAGRSAGRAAGKRYVARRAPVRVHTDTPTWEHVCEQRPTQANTPNTPNTPNSPNTPKPSDLSSVRLATGCVLSQRCA